MSESKSIAAMLAGKLGSAEDLSAHQDIIDAVHAKDAKALKDALYRYKASEPDDDLGVVPAVSMS